LLERLHERLQDRLHERLHEGLRERLRERLRKKHHSYEAKGCEGFKVIIYMFFEAGRLTSS